MKKALFSIILIAIVGTVLFKTISPVTAAPFSMTVDAATDQQIKQATVMIAMYEFDNSGGRGLGTVVNFKGQTVIITHDHWSHLNQNLFEVEFSDAWGRLLLVMGAAEFQGLILYRDGGTMVLEMPTGLTGFVPASLAGADEVERGDSLWMARRVPTGTRDQVEVAGAIVDQISGTGPAYLMMRTSDNSAVIPGDSGGGVWINGKLVANLWSGSLVVGQNWVEALIGSEKVEETNGVNAALIPFGNMGTDSETTDETAVLSAKLDLGG